MKKSEERVPNGDTEPGQPDAGAPGISDDSGELAIDVDIESDAEPLSAEPGPGGPDQRIAELEAQIHETRDRYLRTMADLDNVRKRTRKDIDEARVDAQTRVLREMLPVVDNLERALAHAADQGDGATGIVDGLKLVVRQFLSALERVGVTPVAALGEPFDPNQHEAVSQIETAEAPVGSVVDVLQTGYTIGERLLRPALVVVAKAPARDTPSGDDGSGDDGSGDDGSGDDGSDGANGRDPDAVN